MAPDGRMYNATGKKSEIAELKQALNASEPRERRKAVKRVVAAMTLGRDVSSLFPDVIKNGMTADLPLKKLVYLYIINYARCNPDLVILVINTFVRDAADPNPLVRALSLRTMALIRLDKVMEYVADPMHKALRDPDPYVRKTAAVCVAKLYDYNPEMVKEEGFISMLQDLLADANPMTVSNAVAALSEIAESSNSPDLLSLSPSTVPKYLSAISECTEWGQVFILDAISRYKPQGGDEAHLMVERIIPRMQHANPSVVLAAVRIIVSLMPLLPSENDREFLINKMRAPVVSLLTAPPEMQFVALRNMSLLLRAYPKLFDDDASVFFASYSDPLYVKIEKLDILVRLANVKNGKQIISELKEYASEVDYTFVRKAVSALGRLAVRLPALSSSCVSAVENLLKTRSAQTAEEAAIALQDIFRKYPGQFDSAVNAICEASQHINEPFGRAALVWIVGEHADRIPTAPEMLDVFLNTLHEETAIVQLQILTAAVKLYLLRGAENEELVQRALSFATEATDNVDLRERGIFYARILHANVKAAHDVVITQKPAFNNSENEIEPDLYRMLLTRIGTIASIYHEPVSRFQGAVERDNIDNLNAQPQIEEDLLGLESDSSSSRIEGSAGQLEAKLPEDKVGADDSSGINIDELLGLEITPSAPTGGSSSSVSNNNNSVATSGGGGFLKDIFGLSGAGNSGKMAASKGSRKTGDGLLSFVRERVLLPADKGNGLAIRGGLYQTSDNKVALALEFENVTSAPMTGFAIQLNKNAFGFVPAGPLVVKEPLQPGRKSLSTLYLNPSSTADIEKGVTLQIAFKYSPGGVVYCAEKVLHTLDAVLASKGSRMEKSAYLATWAATPDNQEMTVDLAQSGSFDMTRAEAVVQRLESSRIFLVAKRTSDDRTTLYLSALIVGPLNCTIMAELTLPRRTGEPGKLASRSPIGSIAAPFLQALGATCQRLLS